MNFKSKVLLLPLLLITNLSNAQNIFPSFADSASWNVLECFWSNCITKNYHFDYDTVLCGQAYSKITFDVNGNAYFRADTSKVYFRKSTNCSDKEYLIYDFSINVGDTVFVGYDLFWNSGKDTAEFILASIDTVNYFGINRVRFTMLYDPINIGGPFFRPMNWIKGIGSDTHPFYPFSCLWDGCESGYSLLCYDSSSIHLFQDTLFSSCDTTIIGMSDIKSENILKIFPSPFHDQINFELENSHAFSVEFFSFLGKPIRNFKIPGISNFSISGGNLDPGIYLLKIQTDKGIYLRRIVKL
jgi:hypothetical protein